MKRMSVLLVLAALACGRVFAQDDGLEMNKWPYVTDLSADSVAIFMSVKIDGTWYTVNISLQDFVNAAQDALYGATPADSTGIGRKLYGVAGETLKKGDWLYHNADGLYYKSDATDSTKMPVAGICCQNAIYMGVTKVMWDGIFRRDADTWSGPGKILYAATTAGIGTESPLTGDKNISEACAETITTHIIKFKPDLTTLRRVGSE